MGKLVSVIALLLPMTLFAQERPAFTAPANSIYAGADGKYEAAPDTAVIQFNISAQENTTQAAYERASKAAEQVRQVMRSNGIDPRTAEVGSFSLAPVYDYRSAKRKLVAYRVNTAATLKLKDFAKLGPIFEQLSSIDITENQTVNYTLEDLDAAKKKAVEDAVRRARESANAAATAAGRALGELSYASVDVFEPAIPMRVMSPRAMQMEGAAPPAVPPPTGEFTPQKIAVTAHVNALFLLK
jgi:uncharacterized protein YggE